MGLAKGSHSLVNSTVRPGMSVVAEILLTVVFLSTLLALIFQKLTF